MVNQQSAMMWNAMAVVGRVARAHGIRGQVIVNLETDFPEARFQPGGELFVERNGVVETLRLSSVRFQQGRPVIAIDGVDTMNAAEALAGRRFKRLAAALAFVLVLAVGFAVMASIQRAAVVRETEKATQASIVANQQREVAATQQKLAEERLTRITDGLRMKRAVLTGDRDGIRQFLETARTSADLAFTARAIPRGYRDSTGRPIYRFILMPDNTGKVNVKEVATVTYRMDHPTFRNGLLTTGPERSFEAEYDGWGCLRSVTVLVEYVDPDRSPALTEFDMCARLGW